MQLQELASGYLKIIHSAVSDGHYAEIERSLDRFQKWLADRKMPQPDWSQITPQLVQEYLVDRAEQQSNYRSNKERGYLSTFVSKYVNGIMDLPGNPVARTLRRTHDAEPQAPPTGQEIDRLRLVARGQDRAILEAYLGTAARRDEIYRWIWKKDIRLDRKQYRLGTRKSGGSGMQYEWLPMNDQVHRWLSWWKNNRPVRKAHVFYSLSSSGGIGGGNSNYGKPFKKRSHFIRQLSKKAGISPPLGYHHLRRFVATELARAGFPIKAIQRFMRHKSMRTTEIYIGHVNVDLESMAQALVRK